MSAAFVPKLKPVLAALFGALPPPPNMLPVLFCPALPNGLAVLELFPGEKSELLLAPPKMFDEPEVPDVCPKIDF